MSNTLLSDSFYFSPDTLSLIYKYTGSTFVIKYGGTAMKDMQIRSQVVQDLSLLHFLGLNIILVHGGGIFVNNWLSKLNIQPRFEDGVRVTDSQTMDIVEMVLIGKINKNLVSLLNKNNILSVGLSGQDANLVVASRMYDSTSNLTGRIDLVNPKLLELLISNKLVPVVASVAADYDGNRYNVNADTVAGHIASAIGADKLILLTDTPGVLRDTNDNSTLIKNLDFVTISQLKSRHIISNGMIPKIDSCVYAVNNKVASAHIIDGTIKHALLHEVLTYNRIGSMIVP